jgi:hypothetical protein
MREPLIGGSATGAAAAAAFGGGAVAVAVAALAVDAADVDDVAWVPGAGAVRVFCVAAGVFGFASSGKILGATAAQIQRTISETSTATKIRFSI